MPKARPTKVNPRLEKLMRDALKAAVPEMNIQELGKATGFGRNVGPIVRGEVQRLAPEQANVVVKHLPITMLQLLAAMGYDVPLTSRQTVPDELAEAWNRLDADSRRSLLQIAQAAARGNSGEGAAGS